MGQKTQIFRNAKTVLEISFYLIEQNERYETDVKSPAFYNA
jgi:hypothetical protein